MHTPRFLRILAATLCALLLLAALPVQAARPAYRESWARTKYADKALNKQSFCTLRTEYPVYKTGVSELYFTIENKTSRMLCYGLRYVLEQKRADGWYAQTVVSTKANTVIDFPAIGLIVPPRSTQGQRISLYLPLAAGEYRIVKGIGLDDAVPYQEYTFCAEFTVADTGYDPARLSGYAPLSSLTEEYTHEEAIADGVFYIDMDHKVHNKEALFAFLAKAQQGIAARLRVLNDGVEGQFIVTDVTFLPDGENSKYLVEECTLRDPLPFSIYVGGKPLATEYKKSEITRRYYPFLILDKYNGATQLTLSDWRGEPVEDARQHWLVWDTALVGTSRAKKLLSSPFGEKPTPDYRVYRPDGSAYAYHTYAGDGTPVLAYPDPRNSMCAFGPRLSDGALPGKLLLMEWQDKAVLRLKYEDGAGVKRELTFNTFLGKITASKTVPY